MPREYNISWNADQRARLNSAVRRYNNALRKASRQNPMASAFLPPEVSYKDLKAEITTSRALKNTVNRLSRIHVPNALDVVQQADGSITTRYERREYSIIRSVRERAKAQRAKREGISQPERGRAGNLKQAALSPDKRPLKSISARQIRRFIETQTREINMSKADRARRYYSNYMKALRTVYGGYDEFDGDIDYIEEVIIDMAGNDFERLFKAISEAPDIEYIYEPQAREAKLNRVLDYWNEVDRA